ncbi:MAG TPA: pitrilysin family protein [Candidatus Angelobacter sp.]|jgi:zinc protease|nr:pitrilysin family protein [Candidatus Angelobacter sp.]
MFQNKAFTKISVLAILMALVVGAVAQTSTSAQQEASEKKSTSKVAQEGGDQDLAAADLRAIKKLPLPEFHPQQPKRIELANGMVIFLQEDHELPTIDGIAYIKGGSTSEPAGKVGLVSIYGEAWRTGGTKSKTGDAIDDLLEARAAKIETNGTDLSTDISIRCLKGDFDFVLNLLQDLLRNPEFRQEKIDLAKDQERTGIARRNDNLGGIAAREAAKIGYGPGSPYAREAEYATVADVDRQDLLDWHASHVHPNNIVFVLTGDFDSAAMETKLRGVFESWSKGPDVTRPTIAITPPKAGIYFAEKDDVNQAEIRFIAPGTRRDDPDYYALQIMNHVLGGGFSSRLFVNLRTKAGLAYAVGGGVSALFDHPGLTTLIIGTKSGTTAQAIDGMYKQVEGMQTNRVTNEELQSAKDAILNSFVFQYDSKEKVAEFRANLEFHHYPADFLERYQKGVEKVTAEDVDRVARKYLGKDKFAVLVVGKSADFDKPLSTFGQVTKVDITTPQPGAAVAGAAPAASNDEGKALLNKVIEAAGGAAKLQAIKAMRQKSTITLKAQGVSVEAEETVLGNDKVHLKINTPGGEMIMVATGKAGFLSMAAMGGTQDLPSSQREDTLKGLHREVWYIAQHVDDPKFSFAAQGKEKIGNVEAAVLDINGAGDQLRWFIDPQNGHVLRAQFQGTSPAGPGTQVVESSEWKTVDGVTIPFHQEISSNGQPSVSIAVSNVEFNPIVDAKIFDKPEK